jgi:hypothetical protein
MRSARENKSLWQENAFQGPQKANLQDDPFKLFLPRLPKISKVFGMISSSCFLHDLVVDSTSHIE